MKKFLLCLFLAAGCAGAKVVPPKEPVRKVQSFTMKWHEKCQCMVYITVYTYEE